jgi:hypothetical protein
MFPTLLWQAAFYKLAIVASTKIYGGCQLALYYVTVTELPVPTPGTLFSFSSGDETLSDLSRTPPMPESILGRDWIRKPLYTT